jgi:hypothetical protein
VYAHPLLWNMLMESHGSTATVVDIWKEANAPGNNLSPGQLDFPT